MTTNHSAGPWRYDYEPGYCGELIAADGTTICTFSDEPKTKDAMVMSAAADLLEALEEAVDLAWFQDSHAVQFDGSVMFGPHYDFSNLECSTRQEFFGQYECIVWPGSKWSAYCTYEGATWFEKFDTAEEAKEACMRLLDRVLPDHPAMRARAVIRKARGSQ